MQVNCRHPLGEAAAFSLRGMIPALMEVVVQRQGHQEGRMGGKPILHTHPRENKSGIAPLTELC